MKSYNKSKNTIRSALSGKIINGREVILTSEAVEYVKKMGYIVRVPRDDENILDVIDKAVITFVRTGRISNEI